MLGMEMLVRSFGIDPETLKAQIAQMMGDVSKFRETGEGNARILDALARQNGLDPDAIRNGTAIKEIEHGPD